jgi:hypothetical protein
MPRRLAVTFVALLALTLAVVASQAEARTDIAALVSHANAHAATKAASPSIHVVGISVDTVDSAPGTKITYVPNSPPNACYDIGGPDQSPQQVDVVFFIHAVGISSNAKVTLDVVTPWDSQSRPEAGDPDPSFSKTWFRNKGHGVASAYGGSDAPDNFYTFDDEGTRGNAFNGTYSVSTTAKVDGKVLRAHGTLKVDCVS